MRDVIFIKKLISWKVIFRELKKILKELIELDVNYKKGEIDLNLGLEAILCTYFS